MRIIYVVGFLIKDDRVVLVKKNRPEKWAGRYTGPGGKVEPGESMHLAMTREFREETGVWIPQEMWTHVVTVRTPEFDLHFLRTNAANIEDVRQMESEELFVFPVNNLPPEIFSNTRWALGMALDPGLVLPIYLNYKGYSPAANPSVIKAVLEGQGGSPLRKALLQS